MLCEHQNVSVCFIFIFFIFLLIYFFNLFFFIFFFYILALNYVPGPYWTINNLEEFSESKMLQDHI